MTPEQIIEEHQRIVADHEAYMDKLDAHGEAIEKAGLAPHFGQVSHNFAFGKFVSTKFVSTSQPKKKDIRAG